MEKVLCPSCNESFSESEWNESTKEIVNSLNGNNDDIIPYSLRSEGVLYRCPNINCEDEVITDSNGYLVIQDWN